MAYALEWRKAFPFWDSLVFHCNTNLAGGKTLGLAVDGASMNIGLFSLAVLPFHAGVAPVMRRGYRLGDLPLFAQDGLLGPHPTILYIGGGWTNFQPPVRSVRRCPHFSR
jgi:hypothetical protein